jgi:integrase
VTVLCMARPWRHPKTGVFYFRKVIPERYREFAGMREFKRSLKTSDAREARKRHSAIAGEYDALIERLEAPATPTAEAEQIQAIAVTPGDLYALAGDLWRWLLDRYVAFPAPPEAFSKTAPNGPWGATSEPWSGQRYQIQQARRSHIPAADQGIVAKFVGDFLSEKRIGLGATDRRAFCEAARDAIDGALSDLQRRLRGDLTDSPTLARYPGALPDVPRLRPTVKITGLIEAWEKGRENIRPRTRDEWARRLSQFSEFLGHDDALAVTGKDLRRWRDHLRTKDYKAKTINESCIAPLKAIFAAAAAEEVLKVNPFASLKIALKEDKTKEKPVRPYTEAEAAKLLKAARKRTDALRWLTWLLAYTGARISELCQLRKEDVQRAGTIPFLRFTTSDAKGHELKTGSSRRDVPIHKALVAEGFLKWVAQAKAGWLFVDLPEGRYGRRGDAASKRYGRWARQDVGITDTRAVAHSWRHRMEDKLREVECPDEVADSILGHAREGQRATYGDGPPLSVKLKWLLRIGVAEKRHDG